MLDATEQVTKVNETREGSAGLDGLQALGEPQTFIFKVAEKVETKIHEIKSK